jgi:tetratricopeptide (TPR) repeat protein
MSKPIQSLPTGYYPVLPPPLPALQLVPNPVQSYVHVWEQFYPPAAVLPTNVSSLAQAPVQRVTQVAQGAFWNFPLPMSRYVPPILQLNVPVLPQPPSAPTPTPAAAPPVPAVAQPAPVRRKRSRAPNNHPPQKLTFIPAREQSLPTRATILPLDGTAIMKNLMHNGTTLLKERKYLESITCFRQGFLMDPTVNSMFSLLTRCQAIIKEIRPEIFEYVDDALSRNPKDINALFLHGLCFIEPGKYHIALTRFDSILLENPYDLMVKNLFDEVYRMHNRDIQIPVTEKGIQEDSVKRRMMITTLLNPLNPVTG